MLHLGRVARAVLALFPLSFASAANILVNPSFEIGAGGPFTGFLTGMQSSPATDWGIWSNTAGSTMTELLPTSLPTAAAGSKMLHVNTAGADNGAFQSFTLGTYNAGVWVYVLSGNVGLGLVGGAGNVTWAEQTNNVLNQWIFLNTSSPLSTLQVAIFSRGGGANFYADRAIVDASPIVPDTLNVVDPAAGVPEASSMELAALGGSALLIARRRRRAS